jgi:hypothetical protein
MGDDGLRSPKRFGKRKQKRVGKKKKEKREKRMKEGTELDFFKWRQGDKWLTLDVPFCLLLLFETRDTSIRTTNGVIVQFFNVAQTKQKEMHLSKLAHVDQHAFDSALIVKAIA